jgi:arsenite methyltransferase
MTEKFEKVNYGIDAPGLVKFFFFGGLVVASLCILANLFWTSATAWQKAIQIGLAVIAAYLLGMSCLMIYWSKIGKLRERDEVVSEIKWTGKEQVLDVGCGRGLMLIAAGKMLKSGNAVGIDTWEAKDQHANSPEATLDNARLEGVIGKIAVQTADMRALPFEAESFDLIVSHWVVHNLAIKEDRDLTIKEMVRVLRPGGVIALSDIENRSDYVKQLKTLGMTNCRVSLNSFEDTVLGLVSFGSFRPATIYAEKPV